MYNSLADYCFSSSSFIQRSCVFSKFLSLSEPNTFIVIWIFPLINHSTLKWHHTSSSTSLGCSMLGLWERWAECEVWRVNACHRTDDELWTLLICDSDPREEARPVTDWIILRYKCWKINHGITERLGRFRFRVGMISSQAHSTLTSPSCNHCSL